MEAMQQSRRRRVYSLEPDAMVYASFPHNYVSNLLPALIKAASIASNGKSKDKEIKKLVRFEIDMALVLSAGDFRWSRALKHKLEHGANEKPYEFPIYQSTITCKDNSHFTMIAELGGFQPFQFISNPLIFKCNLTPSMNTNLHPIEETGPRSISRPMRDKKKMMIQGEEEFGFCLRTLRRILPGGNEMDVCELLSEVESYVLCLELQVSVLSSLVGTH